MSRQIVVCLTLVFVASVIWATPVQAADYWVVTRTGENDGAGTDADVEIKLIGTKGDSKWLVLDEAGDDRERGDVNIYILNIKDIGDVQKVQLRAREESKTPDAPKWYLDRVSVLRGDVPDGVKALLKVIGNEGTQKARKRFESAFRKVAKEFTFDCWIEPGKYADRGTPKEWVVVERP